MTQTNNKTDMCKMRAILFDLDGTLLNTTEGVTKAAMRTIAELELPKIDNHRLGSFVGPPIQDSFQRVYGMDSVSAQKAANIFRAHYSGEYLMKAEPYEGIVELLCALKEKDFQLAVATYKRHDYAERIMEAFGITKYLDFYQGADNENQLTKADIIEMCLEALGRVPKEQTVLIGDSAYDAIGAKNAGISFIGVVYGFGFTCPEDIFAHENIGCATSVKMLSDILL